MNTVKAAELKKIQEARIKEKNEGMRLATATENFYTAKLNEGFEEIADGILVAILPPCIKATQTEISRYSESITVILYPTNWTDFSTFDMFKYRDSGIHIHKFEDAKFSPGFSPEKFDEAQLKVMEAILAHVEYKIFCDWMLYNVHELVMETQMLYGDFEPYDWCEGGYFPRSMKTPEVVSQVMVALAEKLEAMI